MATNSRTLTGLEKLIASKNSIPLNEIEKIEVRTDNCIEIIKCYLKLPERYRDNTTTLTDIKRKRKRCITGLGIYGVKFEVVFWVTYFYSKNNSIKEKQETRRYRYSQKIFYKRGEGSGYTKSVLEEVVKLHLKGLNNLEIIEHLKDEHGVSISEREIRRMLKFKAKKIKIEPFGVKTLGIDEAKIKGINKTCVVLQDLDRACILGIAKGKKAASVEELINEVKKRGSISIMSKQ